uniref:S1 motif domain-containing protein n=1 Tax=Mucochytrium quahogii TaxID=96639 RepID=A0A7S2WJ02_9STRA|mmetsp:Transcript_25457/g.55086  ORF Transcript_25457/g.55086 Transcript_25457/m.55086 type:complete len:637 (+) Transcript_25457:186-2096(+)
MFPRGGSLIRPASAGASEEKKAVAGGESLFKIAGDHKVKKKKQDKKRESFGGVGGSKKRKSREADSDDVEKKSTRANSLQLKTLEPGTQILGVVTKVSKRNATVSLPCGLNGFVGIEHLSDQHEASSDQVSDSVADYLSVGDMVRCAVVEVERLEHNKRRLLLSLAASAMNSQETIRLVKEGSYVYGNVQSVEDHGYVVSLGSDSCTGFLSFKVGGGSFDTPALKIGQVVEAIVSSVVEEGKKGKKTGGKRVLQLDSTRSKVDEFVVESCPKLDALQAGFLVKAKKREYLEDGLAMTFCGFYNGTVDMFHLDDWKLDPKMRRENRKKPRQGTLMARVLFVNFKTKEIGLTLVPNLVNRGKDAVERTIASCKRVGHVIDECAVERIDQHKGVLLSVKLDDDENKMEDDSELFAYAKRSTISKGSEDPEEIVQLNKKYKVGQIVPAKVLGFAAIDNVFNVSLAQSVIDASVLHYDELKPGMKVKGKIAKIMDKGMFVSLSDNVQGFIHANQLSDVAISDPSSRFNVGETLNLRVLVVQFEGNRPKIYLTNKRSIVTSSLPPITSFDEAIPGSVAQGYVDHTSKANGVIVKFFNNVRGQVSGSELESMGVDNPQETYPVSCIMLIWLKIHTPVRTRDRY